MIIDFAEIRQFIPRFTFNEYGQLTGNYVHFSEIVCVKENGRIKIWLNRESMEANDAERLICDYAESDLLAMG